MRLGIKGKQVLGVTTIVGAMVIVLSLMHLAQLARVNLDESRSRCVEDAFKYSEPVGRRRCLLRFHRR